MVHYNSLNTFYLLLISGMILKKITKKILIYFFKLISIN